MPGRDGKGPQGLGSMTGRGLGVCRGANATMYGQGKGQGLGLGRGRGIRAGMRGNISNSGNFTNVPMQGAVIDEMSEETLKVQKEELLKRVELIDKQLDVSSEEKM